ncbi:hypothetical protein [Moorena sp. SIO4G3]|uniref:hypothetical protein n=1 Tax=Moorena sp. SIO4G3 TaxID=2607821 RepID=UPI00142B3E78|nr:hypothetical protein [Moorena sp. SIO4G3]NEO79422.1 hypothetical protein [Moorena sp. SIO4G3]
MPTLPAPNGQVWWANGQAVRVQIAFRLVFAHPTEPNAYARLATFKACHATP